MCEGARASRDETGRGMRGEEGEVGRGGKEERGKWIKNRECSPGTCPTCTGGEVRKVGGVCVWMSGK